MIMVVVDILFFCLFVVNHDNCMNALFPMEAKRFDLAFGISIEGIQVNVGHEFCVFGRVQHNHFPITPALNCSGSAHLAVAAVVVVIFRLGSAGRAFYVVDNFVALLNWLGDAHGALLMLIVLTPL
jgi:hypothetical protein